MQRPRMRRTHEGALGQREVRIGKSDCPVVVRVALKFD